MPLPQVSISTCAIMSNTLRRNFGRNAERKVNRVTAWLRGSNGTKSDPGSRHQPLTVNQRYGRTSYDTVVTLVPAPTTPGSWIRNAPNDGTLYPSRCP